MDKVVCQAQVCAEKMVTEKTDDPDKKEYNAYKCADSFCHDSLLISPLREKVDNQRGRQTSISERDASARFQSASVLLEWADCTPNRKIVSKNFYVRLPSRPNQFECQFLRVLYFLQNPKRFST